MDQVYKTILVEAWLVYISSYGKIIEMLTNTFAKEVQATQPLTF